MYFSTASKLIVAPEISKELLTLTGGIFSQVLLQKREVQRKITFLIMNDHAITLSYPPNGKCKPSPSLLIERGCEFPDIF